MGASVYLSFDVQILLRSKTNKENAKKKMDAALADCRHAFNQDGKVHIENYQIKTVAFAFQTYRHLRIRELLKQHSSEASLVVM